MQECGSLVGISHSFWWARAKEGREAPVLSRGGGVGGRGFVSRYLLTDWTAKSPGNPTPGECTKCVCMLVACEQRLSGFLATVFQPMKPLKAAATTSQPVLTSQQIETIFFKVPELYEIHKEFYDGLLPRVQQWSHQQRVGDLFQKLVSLTLCFF